MKLSLRTYVAAAFAAAFLAGCAGDAAPKKASRGTNAATSKQTPKSTLNLKEWAAGLPKDEEGVNEQKMPSPEELDSAIDFIHGVILVEAAGKGQLQKVRESLAQGIDPNFKDGHGNTALIEASRSGHIDIVRVLLDAGADRTVTNGAGESAAAVARASGHQEILTLLQAK